MIRYYKFKVFVKDNGKKDFEAWMDKLNVNDYAKIDRRINNLEKTKQWDSSNFKKLKGYVNLYEIKVRGQNNVPFRPLVCRGPKDNEFTILLGAKKKSNRKYIPINALATADKRSKLIYQRGRTDDYF